MVIRAEGSRPTRPAPAARGVQTVCVRSSGSGRTSRKSAAALCALALLAAGCSKDAPATTTTATPTGAAPADTVTGRLGDVDLVLEVADDQQERATGLMGREQVSPGTGMVFLYDEPSDGRFYMFRVPVPLRAVFISGGRVVSSVLMPPCREQQPQDCPTYGADGPYDTVVETAPETLPDVAPGDSFTLTR